MSSLSNVRILSKAFANQRIDRETYLSLRRKQIEAIEAGAPPPELPIEVQIERYSNEDTTPTDVALQTIEIAPTKEEVRKQRPILAIASVIGALALVLLLDWFVFTDHEPTESASEQTIGIEIAAHKLLEKRHWADQDIDLFTNEWISSNASQRVDFRETLWFSRLNRVVDKRITETEKLIEITGSSSRNSETIARLKSLSALINNEQNASQATKESTP